MLFSFMARSRLQLICVAYSIRGTSGLARFVSDYPWAISGSFGATNGAGAVEDRATASDDVMHSVSPACLRWQHGPARFATQPHGRLQEGENACPGRKHRRFDGRPTHRALENAGSVCHGAAK
jgi:hypothetical protein